MKTIDPIRRFIGQGLLAGAAAQAVAAVLFFFAANWWSIPAPVKIGAVDAALVACAVAAALTPAGSVARASAVVAGAVLSGVLFAVHGQIWQTGADAWELFAAWSAAALLWAVAGRADAAWLVTAVVGTLALNGWAGIHLPAAWTLSLAATVPLGMLAVRRVAGPPAPWLFPALGAGAAGLLAAGGLTGLAHDTRLPLMLGLGLAGAAMAVFRPARTGPWPFGIALVLAVVLVETLAVELISKIGDDQSATASGLRLLAAGGLLLAGLAVLARLLRRLFRTSGWGERLLAAGIGTGAWLAALVAALGCVFLALAAGIDDHAPLVAAIASATAAAAMRGTGSFATQARAAFAAQAHLGLVLEMSIGLESTHLATAVAVGLLPVLLAVSRTAGTGVVGTVTALVFVAVELRDLAPAATAAFVLASAGAGWLLLDRPSASVRACAVVLLAGAFVGAAAQELAQADSRVHARAAAGAAALGLMAAVMRRRPELARPRIVGAGLATVAASLLAPAGAAGLVGLTAAAARSIGRPLVAMGFAAAAWSVSRYYYSLAVPLDEKALYLAAGAGVTALAWALAADHAFARPRSRPGLAAALLGCALLPAAVEAVDARAKSEVMEKGRVVLLPLAPADPRSLIQGDYMRLRYDRALTSGLPAKGGPAYLTVDGEGVARAARPAEGAESSDEVRVVVRAGRSAGRLAPDSFLFPGGSAETWERARFAIVRIKDGDLVLAGLADEDRRPIHLPAD